MDVHAAFDAAADGVALVGGEIVAGAGAEEAEDALHRLGRHGRRFAEERGGGEVRAAGVRDEAFGHVGGRQDVIGETGGDGGGGHAGVFGGEGLFDHDHAGFAFDGDESEGAVGAGAGEDDADGEFFLIGGEGAEEEVDGEVGRLAAPVATRRRTPLWRAMCPPAAAT